MASPTPWLFGAGAKGTGKIVSRTMSEIFPSPSPISPPVTPIPPSQVQARVTESEFLRQQNRRRRSLATQTRLLDEPFIKAQKLGV